jgi:hypothetical protein
MGPPRRRGSRLIVGVLSLSLPIPAAPGSLLISVRLSPAPVVVGQVLGVLLVPAAHARLAPWSATVLARAVPAELRSRLLLPALGAALQVIRRRRGAHAMPSRMTRSRRSERPRRSGSSACPFLPAVSCHGVAKQPPAVITQLRGGRPAWAGTVAGRTPSGLGRGQWSRSTSGGPHPCPLKLNRALVNRSVLPFHRTGR